MLGCLNSWYMQQFWFKLTKKCQPTCSTLCTMWDSYTPSQVMIELNATCLLGGSSDPEEYPFNRDMINLQMTKDPQSNPMRSQSAERFEGKTKFNSSYGTTYKGSEPPFPLSTCWTFQHGQTCFGCDWPDTHKCCHCQGAHPGSKCYRNNRDAHNSAIQYQQ